MNFPSTLESFEYNMCFAFKQYQMPEMVTQQINKQRFLNETAAIRLPLPNSMIDAQHVEYSAEGIGLAGAAAVTAAKKITNFKPKSSTGGAVETFKSDEDEEDGVEFRRST